MMGSDDHMKEIDRLMDDAQSDMFDTNYHIDREFGEQGADYLKARVYSIRVQINGLRDDIKKQKEYNAIHPRS